MPIVTHQNKTQQLWQWAKDVGLPVDLVYERVHRYGWTVEAALTTPVGAARGNKAKHKWREALTKSERQELDWIETQLQDDIGAVHKASLKERRYKLQNRGTSRARLAAKAATTSLGATLSTQ